LEIYGRGRKTALQPNRKTGRAVEKPLWPEPEGASPGLSKRACSATDERRQSRPKPLGNSIA
jgi:hypothetical protein